MTTDDEAITTDTLTPEEHQRLQELVAKYNEKKRRETNG